MIKVEVACSYSIVAEESVTEDEGPSQQLASFLYHYSVSVADLELWKSVTLLFSYLRVEQDRKPVSRSLADECEQYVFGFV